ncbi:MAG: IS66 family transposase [Bdellovibrionales bacterium]
MTTAQIIILSEYALRNTAKEELITMILSLRESLKKTQEDSEIKLSALQEKLSTVEAELSQLTQANINQAVNQPSSKKPEFAKDTKPSKQKKTRKKKREGRKGAGNRPKPIPDVVHTNTLSCCPDCQRNLVSQPVIETVSRIVEDIPPVPEKTIISEEVQERKWCPDCAKIVSSVSEAALPRSDIGLNALCLIAYLWVVSAISLPGITAFLNSFFRLRLSTAGISRMMIRLANMMTPVYDEILNDVKGGTLIFADETGWRVKGVLWWLWIFANKRSAYYWPDKQRGSPVVLKILGAVFGGVLVTDAWCAYMKIVCAKQTCMAHIFRKIRAFRDAYPQYYSIFIFYRKLRRILSDGEKLQAARKEVGEVVFLRRLSLLKKRLKKLLAWKNPNAILKAVIAKVKRQSAHILTFVQHEGVPTHNNYGEYIIKKGILKRKVSGGSMSEEGVRAYAVIQSIAQTCLLRKLSLLAFLRSSLVHYIRTGKPMLLGEFEIQSINLKAAA